MGSTKTSPTRRTRFSVYSRRHRKNGRNRSKIAHARLAFQAAAGDYSASPFPGRFRMGTGTNGSSATSATKVLLRVGFYYVCLTALGVLAWRYLPHANFIGTESLDSLFGSVNMVTGKVSKNAQLIPAPDQGTFAATVAFAMIAALACSLPVAWIYTLTRSRRGYSQSVVQMLVIMPVAVSGIFVLVKYSTALAFGLGGIAAAVRFRNTL